MMMELLDLPSEILSRILSFLDLCDLGSVSTTHPNIYHLVKASSGLQFRFAAYAAAVELNPYSNLASSERLSALERLEEGWSNLDIDFRNTIQVQHRVSGLYDLTAGACVLGDIDRETLHHCRLPSHPDDQVKWSKIKVGFQIVDFGLAIHEHDLIAVLTLTHHSQFSENCLVEIRLLQFSTGKFHPLARIPVLIVETTDWSHPAILIEIVGDHLVLTMTHALFQLQPQLSDRLHVFNWKTGARKMTAFFPCQTYHGVVFLSPKILCLPNKRMNTLDIWLIPDTPIVKPDEPLPPLKPFLFIGLPNLSPTHALITSLCRAEPNPTPSGTSHSTQPFHPIAEDSIVIFSFRGVHRATMRIESFTIFVHRSKLLDIVLARNPDHAPDPILAHRIVLHPWEHWGPTMTRMFEATNTSLAWITTTAGQRCAMDLTHPNEESTAQTVNVLDFNPRTVRRLSKKVGETDDASRMVHSEESVIEHEMFEGPVTTSLPYVSRMLSLENDSDIPFKGVLLDEERLLGIKLDEADLITAIEVMHIGRLDSRHTSAI